MGNFKILYIAELFLFLWKKDRFYSLFVKINISLRHYRHCHSSPVEKERRLRLMFREIGFANVDISSREKSTTLGSRKYLTFRRWNDAFFSMIVTHFTKLGPLIKNSK